MLLTLQRQLLVRSVKKAENRRSSTMEIDRYVDAMKSFEDTKTDWSKEVTAVDNPDDYADDHEFKVKFYNDNAENYNSDFLVNYKYMYPKVAAANLHQYLEGRVDANILDVGAGTGLASAELKKLADYNNIEGLDPAGKMLDVAQQTNIYTKVHVQPFGIESGIDPDHYDAVLSVGAMIPGHLRADSVKEMVKIVKPGGYVCLVFRAENMTIDPDIATLRPMIVEMVDEGKITVECDKEVEKAFLDIYSIQVFVMKKL